MGRNSFKDLENIEIEKLSAPVEDVKSSVNHNLSVFQMAGDVVQLFIPKIISLFLSLLGGEEKRDTDPDHKYPNLRG